MTGQEVKQATIEQLHAQKAQLTLSVIQVSVLRELLMEPRLAHAVMAICRRHNKGADATDTQLNKLSIEVAAVIDAIDVALDTTPLTATQQGEANNG